MSRLLTVAAALFIAAGVSADEQEKKVLRVGIIGLDTSHVTAFTSVLNKPGNTGELAGVRVVAAYPGGSADVDASRTRVEGFTKQLREKYNVEIVDSVEALLPKVDVVLLESVDGRPHLKQALPVLAAGKPIFIDKPVAGSLADAILIFDLAKQHNVPCFSSSSLRYAPAAQSLAKAGADGSILGCNVYAPCEIEPHHPDLFWYGIHGVEMLFAVMGPGCESVSRVHTKDTDLVTGVWSGGRIGTFRGIRPKWGKYGLTAFTAKGAITPEVKGGYEPLLVEVCKFFKTGQAPVRPEQTIEIFAFMEAADESKRRGGTPVTLKSVLSKAREEAQQKTIQLKLRGGAEE